MRIYLKQVLQFSVDGTAAYDLIIIFKILQRQQAILLIYQFKLTFEIGIAIRIPPVTSSVGSKRRYVSEWKAA
jgi:hypothetical protein